MQLSIRQKLNVAVGVLAALALVSNVVSGLFSVRVQATYAGITQTSIPAVVAALNLATISAETAAGAPTVASALTDAEREQGMADLQARLERLKQTLELVKASADPSEEEHIAAVEKTIEFLTGRIAQINRSVTARLDWTKQRQDAVARLGDDFTKFQAAFQPALASAIAELRKPDAAADTAAAANALIAAGNAVNQLVSVLAVAGQATNNAELDKFAAEFQKLNAAVLEQTDAAARKFDIAELQALARTLAGYGAGGDSIFQLRRGELRTVLTSGLALKQTRDSAAELATKVEALVGAASKVADDAAASASAQSMTAQVVQVGITVICLIVAALIGFAFIGPQVAAPIARLTQAMRRLAERDWSVDLAEAKRADEIGDMARAVEVFKTAGQENEKLQREVEAGRAAFEAERKQQEALLEQAIGGIVAAATAGDLSRRIDAASLQGVMRTLGEGVNELLATMDSALNDLGAMLAALADGDLKHRIAQGHRGVFEQLANDANGLAQRLTDVVGRLTQSAGLVRDAASEISAGSKDLADRTEQQAASLQRTAASMEQITATVRHNADNARQASQVAGSARDEAEKGGAVARDAVAAMGRIEESARKISDIVALIDEIAFQTNLLALNASVEAARAGEAGKGFAVVAQEVRALAQRSAEASKEIKGLIAASNSEVRDGAKLVNQAGASLSDIVNAVKRVAGIIEEIDMASQEQATGLDEINDQVAQMDEMTQRNGALVEETTASAQAMADQARGLTELVGFFRLADSTALSAAA